MASLNPYLNFNGNTEEAFEFYKSVFGGEFTSKMKFKDVPAEYQGAPGESEKILHISLPIGSSVLMGSDSPDAFGKVNFGNNLHVAIHAATVPEADKLFKGLSAGGNVIMPMEKAFWGDYFGMFVDKYGVHWMISQNDKTN